MKTEELPVAVWSGSFRLFGIEMKCHTLSDGRRIIEADSIAEFLRVLADGSDVQELQGDAEFIGFAKWQRGQ